MKKLKINEFKQKLFAARSDAHEFPSSPFEFERIRLGSLIFVFKVFTIPKSFSCEKIIKLVPQYDVDVLLCTSYFNQSVSLERMITNKLFSIGVPEGRVVLFWCLLNRLIKLILK